MMSRDSNASEFQMYPSAVDSHAPEQGFLVRYAFDRLDRQFSARREPQSPVFTASSQEFTDEENVLSLRPEVGAGHTRFVRLAPGAILAMSRFQVDRPLKVSGHLDGNVTFTLNLGGGYRITLGGRTLCLSGPSALVVKHPASSQSSVEYLPGVKTEIISVVFSGAQALHAFGLGRGDLLPALRVCAAESPAIEACAALQHAPYAGQLRSMYLQAKVRELICHILAAPVIADGARRQQKAGTNAKNIAAVVESQLSRVDRHVSVEEIAEEIGVSTNHLRRMYRSARGCTIRDAALKARMTRARHLLSETRLPIIDIALALGYEHHASFSTAYRKEFGETPMRTRRRSGVATQDT